jgi:hypothetical protein
MLLFRVSSCASVLFHAFGGKLTGMIKHLVELRNIFIERKKYFLPQKQRLYARGNIDGQKIVNDEEAPSVRNGVVQTVGPGYFFLYPGTDARIRLQHLLGVCGCTRKHH